MLKRGNDSATSAIMQVADLMAAAALTAPKTSGQDKIVTMIVSGDDKKVLSDAMLEFYEETEKDFIKRDAYQILDSEAVVLIGVKKEPYGMVGCQLCGYGSCAKLTKAGGNCVFNITDLGVAVGSAVSIAADNRIDNRVMYSVGMGAIKCGMLGDEISFAYGIPLSVSCKSIYFDRDSAAIMNARG